jgi:CheY-like chemotaxis protein
MKILIIDDDVTLLEMCNDLFKLWGYEPVCCSNREQVLSACWSVNIDLCIIDVILPGINGFELSREILKTGTRCPFIFWTGYEIGRNYIKSRQTSEVIVLNKPFEKNHLKSLIDIQVRSYKERSIVRPIAELEINFNGNKRFIRLSDSISIGRGSNNDLRIPSDKISSTHMMLVRMYDDNESFYRIVDGELGGRPSTNGIFINNTRLRKGDYKDLGHYDQITIPDVQFVYRLLNYVGEHFNKTET